MAKILSKGITLSANGNVIPGLIEVPDLGGSPEKVDVTTLADANRQYINGIQDYGELTFKFVYDAGEIQIGEGTNPSNYDYLISVITPAEATNTPITWKVSYPGVGGKTFGFEFKGSASLTMDAMSVNSALTFTLTIAVSSDVKRVTNG